MSRCVVEEPDASTCDFLQYPVISDGSTNWNVAPAVGEYMLILNVHVDN